MDTFRMYAGTTYETPQKQWGSYAIVSPPGRFDMRIGEELFDVPTPWSYYQFGYHINHVDEPEKIKLGVTFSRIGWVLNEPDAGDNPTLTLVNGCLPNTNAWGGVCFGNIPYTFEEPMPYFTILGREMSPLYDISMGLVNMFYGSNFNYDYKHFQEALTILLGTNELREYQALSVEEFMERWEKRKGDLKAYYSSPTPVQTLLPNTGGQASQLVHDDYVEEDDYDDEY